MIFASLYLNSLQKINQIEVDYASVDLDSSFYRAGVKIPTVEVRFKNLTVEADCFIGERALPTLANAARDIAEAALSCFGIKLSERTKVHILKDVSGIIRPSR